MSTLSLALFQTPDNRPIAEYTDLGEAGELEAAWDLHKSLAEHREVHKRWVREPSDRGIIPMAHLKYWLEVSPEEQTRRLEGRIDDGRKIWKLSDMDLKSYSRWYDYSRARDEMFLASDTAWAPWYVARSDDKRRARLNVLTHILSKIPYEALPREKVELPKRQHHGDYKDPNYPFRLIPEVF